MEESNLQLIKQESHPVIQLSTKDIRTEEIFVYEGIIKHEPPNDETSIASNCTIGIGDYNSILPDLDSFENVIKTETFLSIEKEDDIDAGPLEIWPVKIEEPFQVDYLFSSEKNEDQSISILPNVCSISKSSAAMKEETMHKKIKIHSCRQCHYKSSIKSDLTKHVNSVHKGIKPFQCNECDFKCSTKRYLTTHVNSVHKGSKPPFKCSQCDYISFYKFLLTSHVKSVHKGIKPFQCNECDHTYSKKGNLIQHINTGKCSS